MKKEHLLIVAVLVLFSLTVGLTLGEIYGSPKMFFVKCGKCAEKEKSARTSEPDEPLFDRT